MSPKPHQRIMKIALAADHAGFDLKSHVKRFLEGRSFAVVDLGAFNKDPSDYPDFAAALGRTVRAHTVDRGILICGSGVGACIAANKLRGIRAGLCHDSYSARQGVEHDDMNVLVLGARVIGLALAEDLVENFVRAVFSGEERHLRRLKKIRALEKSGR